MRLDIKTTPSASPNISRTTTETAAEDPHAKTKEEITSFLHKDGQADTLVHETVKPAVVNEHINEATHDESQDIIDREIHQDHHHLSVQPIHETETQPATHTHRQSEVETREVSHGDDAAVKQKIAAEAGQFHDTRDVADVSHTASTGPTVTGEHVHHHVHETIQPVVEKDILQPHVIHTTHPIHEIHHNEPQHHAASNLPEVSMDEFQKRGGKLAGREERTQSFEGPPTVKGEEVKAPPLQEKVLVEPAPQEKVLVEPAPQGAEVVTVPTQPEEAPKEQVESERFVTNVDRPAGVPTHTEPSPGISKGAAGVGAVGTGTSTGLSGGVAPKGEKVETEGRPQGAGGKKPSMMDRLNPMKDTSKEKGQKEMQPSQETEGRPAQGKKPSMMDRLNPMKETGGKAKSMGS